MSREYIQANFADIKNYASVIEDRLDDSYCTLESVIEDNEAVRMCCEQAGVPYHLIDTEYDVMSLL